MMASTSSSPTSRTRDYVLEMIAELAKLARQNGEMPVAIYLEAIVCAEQAREVPRRAG